MSQDLTTALRQVMFNNLLESQRIALSRDDWDYLLHTMRVPAADCEAAARAISNILTTGVILFGTDAEWTQRKASLKGLAEAGALAKSLLEKLLSLDTSAKRWFEMNAIAMENRLKPDLIPDDLLFRFVVYVMAGRFERFERGLRDIANIAAAATTHYGPPLSGRPPKRLLDCPKIVAFEVTVVHLCAAAARNSWHLTLSHNTDSGTLIDVIRLVEPHMPPGFVPRVLNADRLRSLRNRGRNPP